MRLPAKRYLVLIVVAVLAVAAGAVGAWAATSGPPHTSAKDRIQADPPPALFPTTATQPTLRLVEAQRATADALVQKWFAAHGHGRDDAAFARWVEQVLPGPPSPSRRQDEIAQVQRLAATRTKGGVAASTWLEAHGKKDLWKLYAHDQAEMLSTSAGKSRKADTKAMLKLAKSVADTLGQRYQQSAPYVIHPSLRPDHTVKAGQVCPCSYPSRHAAAGAAAATYLGGLDPLRTEEYQWAEGQIDYSRIYMAGHVPSDIAGGALLGDLIGDYYLHTRT